MRLVLCLLLIAGPIAAQEEPSDSSEPAETLRPGSDSPEAVHPRRYDGPRHRAQAFLIPMDEGARGATARVASALQAVLAHAPQYEVIDLGQALSVDSTDEQAARADEGRRAIGDGDYKKALQLFERGLPAVGEREYSQTLLRLGAQQWLAGDEAGARQTLAAVARLDPQSKVDTHGLGPSVEGALQAARADVEAAPTGVLELDTRPAGGRVQLDGENAGNVPLRVQVAAGKHFVRLERPGFYPHAQLVEVPPRKTATLSITLSATPAATTINQSIAGAADEVGRGTAGKSVAALASKFLLERMLVGSVRSQGSKITVVLALVDAAHSKVLGAKSLLLVADGTDADQVEGDTQAAAHALVAADREEAGPAEPAPERRVVTQSTQPTADDPGLVAHERRVIEPQPQPQAQPAAAPEAPAPVSKEEAKPAPAKKKGKGIRAKTGTENWDDTD